MLKLEMIGNVESTCGLSVHFRMIIKALLNDNFINDNGIQMRLVPRKRDPSTVKLTDDELMLYRRHAQNSFDGQPDVKLYMEPAHFIEPGHPRIIAYTPWETTAIRSVQVGSEPRTNWVSQFNACKAVITPSTAGKEAFIGSGVKTPVHVLPGPIFPHKAKGELAIGGVTIDVNNNFVPKERRAPVIGYMAHWSPRKNITTFIEDCMTAFDEGEAVILLKLSHNNQPGEAEKIVAEIKQARGGVKKLNPPQFCILTENLTDEQIEMFFNSVDIYYAPSHGEGFSLPVSLAAAAGKACIVPAWGGPADYIPSDLCIKGQFSPATCMSAYDAGQFWFDLDRAAAIAKLREIAKVVRTQDAGRRCKGKAFEIAGERTFAERLAAIIKETAT